MMWLVEPISFLNLHGGPFLLFYFTFAVLVLIIASHVLKACDRTDVRFLPPVPSKPDPIEIAYLAGGENNVIRTVLYDLRQRGFIQVDAKLRVHRTQKSARPGELTIMEQHVLDVVKSASTVTGLFDNALLRSAVRSACSSVRARLDAQQLLLPQAVMQTATRVLWIGLSAIVGVALIKVFLTLSQGRTNFGVLLVLTVIASGYLLARVSKVKSSITSRRGSAFLAQLYQAYSGLKFSAMARYGNTRDMPGSAAGVFEGASLFLIGLYGFGLLRGTTDEHIAKAFERGSNGNAAACGVGGCGSSGGSSCCGGGCGGGS